MAMSISQLKTLLAGISGPSFSLTAPQFGVDKIDKLFQSYVPQSTLTIANPKPDAEALQLGGQATLGTVVNVEILVTFLPDATKTSVGGINIKLDLASWTFNTAFANFSGTALEGFGFKSPNLVLSAGDIKLADGAPAAFVSGSLEVKGSKETKIVTLSALIPFDTPATRANIANNYVFAVDLDITLNDLSALTQFISLDFNNVIPTEIPLADTFALKHIEFAIDPKRNQLVSLRLNVGSDKGLTVVPDVFVIKSFMLSFQIIMPGVATQVYGVVATTLDVYGQVVEMSLSAPDLYLYGQLGHDHPVPLKPFVSKFLPGNIVPDNFQLSELAFGLGLRNPHPWVFDIALENLWSVSIGTRELQMTKLSVYLDGVGAKAPGLFIQGQIEFAGTQVYLSAENKQGSTSWLFKGGTVDAGPIVLPDFKSPGVQIGKLLADLGNSFGIDVPDPVKSLELRNIQVSFETGTNKFHFECTGEFKVEETLVILTVTIDTEKKEGTSKYDATFGGTVQIGNLQFDLKFDHKDLKSDIFIAAYSHKAGDPDSISLHDLIAALSPDLAKAVPTGIVIQLKDVKFVFYRKENNPKQFAFGLDLDVKIPLSELPVVGSRLPPDLSLDVKNLQAVYSSKLFPDTDIKQVNSLLPKTVMAFPSEGMSEGINLAADLQLGSKTIHLALGVPPKKQTTLSESPDGGALQTTEALEAPTGGSAALVKWIDVNKQFGIFQFDRIGVGYENNVLSFALDAGVSLGPLSFAMMGLSVGSPLNKFTPVFGLSGLALEYRKPPLEIGGAFLKTTEQSGGKPITSYYGEVMVKAATFNLKAIGGWAPDASPASFFIYLSLKAPLGGPPFFFITGLAGGIGINRTLKLPKIDKLSGFKLLPNNAPEPADSPQATIAKVLPELQEIFQINPGQYWVAAGIQFTSFEMIEAFVLLIIAFGVDLQISLLGTCSMSFPKAETYPVAYIEVDLLATFKPSTGELAVDGKLSPASFIYGGFVKLSGGFAFYAWFSGENKGNFVVSVGGYHPAFTKPDIYPTVPRLAMDFALGPFRVTGQAYFALTPSMMMAGIRMSAVWSSGPIKAWLDAGLDFLISWAPFHYEASAFINIGCSVDLGLFTLNVSVGAGLNVWGPPFGGRVYVDLDVVSFTISFGAEPIAPPPIGWDSFKSKFLPADSTVPPVPRKLVGRRAFAVKRALANVEPTTQTNTIKANVSSGLLQSDVDGFNWVVDPDHFSIVTNSAIPANNAEWALSADKVATLPNTVSSYNPPEVDVTNGPYLELPKDTKTFSDTLVWNPTVNIAPMKQNDVQSYHTIQVCKRTVSDPKGKFSQFITELTAAPELSPSNTALYGESQDKKSPNDPLLLPAGLNGFRMTPIPRKPSSVNDVPLIDLLFAAGFSTGFKYQKAVVDPDYTVTIEQPQKNELNITINGKHTAKLENKNYILSSLIDTWVTGQRATILDDLAANGFSTYKSTEIDLKVMATETALTDWPAVKMMGS